MVYRAWVEIGHVQEWWGPQGFTMVSCQMDVRPGGKWRKEIRSPEGKVFLRYGIYREVVEPERLVFTYVTDDVGGAPDHETTVTVLFAEAGKDRTRLTLWQTGFDTVASAQSHKGGWTSTMERFMDYLKTL
ncbi:MAG: SRPBCC domain-containing protein [Alphaproteobacteria bacterium]|nr:SRPBCC domain-containing protein [Alphaproteobacteria bacterium]MCW5739899.1 SRPBCC domain-containing protein [Alphaproteobacteria bacterium]